MPLNGHSYLVSQGWSGHGKGLREGAISRPLAIPQKRTLAGLGKDRDEAFPFWDHLFDAAAKAIQVKIFNDDDDSNTDNDEAPLPDLNRTSTGLISNRRPMLSRPASSGTATPDSMNRTEGQKFSLLVTAKRDAARKGLYSRFFRGPVLGPETEVEVEVELKVASTSTMFTTDTITTSVCEEYASKSSENVTSQDKQTGEKKIDRKDKEKKEKKKSKDKKRDKGKEKAIECENTTELVEVVHKLTDKSSKDKPAKRKRKDQASSSAGDEVEEKKERKKRRRKDENPDDSVTLPTSAAVSSESKEERQKRRKKDKEERRRRKEEKRKRKEGR